MKQVIKLVINVFVMCVIYHANVLAVITVEEERVLKEIQEHLNGEANEAGKRQMKLILPFVIKKYNQSMQTEEAKLFVGVVLSSIDDNSFDPRSLNAEIIKLVEKKVSCCICNKVQGEEWIKKYPCKHNVCFECMCDDDICHVCAKACDEELVGAVGGVSELSLQELVILKKCPSCKNAFEYEGGGYMKCPVCGKSSCASCEAIHDGKSCSEFYQSLDDERRRNLAIKRCCKKIIVKGDNDLKRECVVCFDDVSYQILADLECDHSLCIDCLASHVNMTENTEVDNGRIKLTCPQPECDKYIPEGIFKLLFSPDRLARKNLEDYTLSGGGRYCPAGCNKLISADEVEQYLREFKPFLCPKCRKEGCLACGEWPYHHGYTCQQNKELSKDEKTLKLLKEQDAQNCPRCGILIVKTHCNRVQCRCGHHFCYKCLKPWTGYGNKRGRQRGANCGCDVWTKERDHEVTLDD
ncbi:hypothetical protein [Endozoicomonas sp. Mp262]|uniref:IBR domain-containing protein n=1 Tax=Endozoicomonas sp. Mp262 TaxID=2919499 RepID=UPI0021DF73ED